MGLRNTDTEFEAIKGVSGKFFGLDFTKYKLELLECEETSFWDKTVTKILARGP